MSEFWQKWLTLWCWGVGLFGLILAGAGFAATDGLAVAVFDLFGAPAYAMDSMHRFAIGLMGAVTMGWGITFYCAFQALHCLSATSVPAIAAPIWRTLTGGAILWFVVDSAISVGTGIPLNAVSNTLFLALYLIPVMRSGVLRG